MSEHDVDVHAVPLDPQLHAWLRDLAGERRFGDRDRKRRASPGRPAAP